MMGGPPGMMGSPPGMMGNPPGMMPHHMHPGGYPGGPPMGYHHGGTHLSPLSRISLTTDRPPSSVRLPSSPLRLSPSRLPHADASDQPRAGAASLSQPSSHFPGTRLSAPTDVQPASPSRPAKRYAGNAARSSHTLAQSPRLPSLRTPTPPLLQVLLPLGHSLTMVSFPLTLPPLLLRLPLPRPLRPPPPLPPLPRYVSLTPVLSYASGLRAVHRTPPCVAECVDAPRLPLDSRSPKAAVAGATLMVYDDEFQSPEERRASLRRYSFEPK